MTSTPDPQPAHPAEESPPYCRHLMTLEAVPAGRLLFDPLPIGPGDYEFLSRCMCGRDIPEGPYEKTMAAIRQHLEDAGLLPVTVVAGRGAADGGDYPDDAMCSHGPHLRGSAPNVCDGCRG